MWPFIDILNAKLDPTPYVVLGPIMTDESAVENSTRITSIKTHYRKMIAGTSKGTVHVWEFWDFWQNKKKKKGKEGGK